MSKIDRKNVLKALTEYAYFILDTEEPKDVEEAKKFDRRRKELHTAVGKALGFDPELPYSSWENFDPNLADYIKDWNHLFNPNLVNPFNKVEDMLEWKADMMIDRLSKDREDRVETKHASWHTRNAAYENLIKEIRERMAPVKEVMDGIDCDFDAWLKYEVDKGKAEYKESDFSTLNFHDYNGEISNIRYALQRIEAFFAQPIAAFTEAAWVEYWEKNWDRIFNAIKTCESIAFRAERMVKDKPFFEYCKKSGHKMKKTHSESFL